MKMLRSRLCVTLSVAGLLIATASPAFALANRVFVSARSGNNANSCDNILTPCQTFAGAVLQLNPGGEAIVLDSGGYGPVTITKSLTIEAPPGVLAFIHPPSGNAITISAGTSDVVTLRGLVLNAGSAEGIHVLQAGTVNVENCSIAGFSDAGILIASPGRLNVKGTDVKSCQVGVLIVGNGTVRASIDNCHLDGNSLFGYFSQTISPGSSLTTATNSTANNNLSSGWVAGNLALSGRDVLYLDFCTGSENVDYGLVGNLTNASSVVGFSNCQFANNGQYGVGRFGSGTVESRVNNTVRNNVVGPNNGTVVSFSPF